jgi:hypothetical protein
MKRRPLMAQDVIGQLAWNVTLRGRSNFGTMLKNSTDGGSAVDCHGYLLEFELRDNSESLHIESPGLVASLRRPDRYEYAAPPFRVLDKLVSLSHSTARDMDTTSAAINRALNYLDRGVVQEPRDRPEGFGLPPEIGIFYRLRERGSYNPSNFMEAI